MVHNKICLIMFKHSKKYTRILLIARDTLENFSSKAIFNLVVDNTDAWQKNVTQHFCNKIDIESRGRSFVIDYKMNDTAIM